MRTIAAAVPLLVLSACAAGTCDPSQAGFLSGIAGEASGCFAERDRALRSNLDAARSDLARQQDFSQRAAAAQGAAIRDRNAAASRLQAMGRENAALRQRLNAASQRADVDRAAVQRQQQNLANLERDRQSAPSDPAAVGDLERRRKAILDAATSY